MIGVLALTMGQASAQRCLPQMQGIEINSSCVDGKPLSAAFCGGGRTAASGCSAANTSSVITPMMRT